MSTILIMITDTNDAVIDDLKKSVGNVLKKGVSDFYVSDSDCQAENEALKQKIRSLENRIDELCQKNDEISNRPKDEYLSQIDSTETVASFGCSRAVKDDTSYYRLFDKNGMVASFDFCGNEMEALLKYPSVLDPFCDYDGIPETSSRIENVSPGEIKYNSTIGRWIVSQKATVKIS